MAVRGFRNQIEKTTQLLNDARTLVEASSQVGLDFLTTDADLGILFAEIALQSGDNSERRHRNRRSGRRAYEAVLRHNKRLRLTEAEAQELEKKLKRLRFLLEQVGERL